MFTDPATAPLTAASNPSVAVRVLQLPTSVSGAQPMTNGGSTTYGQFPMVVPFALVLIVFSVAVLRDLENPGIMKSRRAETNPASIELVCRIVPNEDY
jgi:hypothetical protein